MSTPDFDKKQGDKEGMFDFLEEEAANNPARQRGRRSRKELVMPVIRPPVPISESGPARFTPLSDDSISMLDDAQAKASGKAKASSASTVSDTRNESDAGRDTDRDADTDFEFLSGRVSEPRQASATEFDADWNEGLHQNDYSDEDEKTGGTKKWVLPLLGIGLLGLAGLAFTWYQQQGPDANGNQLITSPGVTTNNETTVTATGTQVSSDSRSLFQRFDEQLKLLEGLVADGKLNEAEQVIGDMDKAVYGYGAPEFSELETRIAGLRAGLIEPQVDDETVAQATQAVAEEQQIEAERIAETERQLAAQQLAEAQRAEEAQRVAEAVRIEEERVAEQQRQAELARAAEQERLAAEAARAAEERAAEERAAEQERLAAEAARVAEERAAEEQRQAELARATEQKRQAAEAARVAEQQRQAEETARLAEQQRQAEADRAAAIELAAQQRQAEQAQQLEAQRQAAADRAAAEALVLAQREAERERIEVAQRAAAQRRAEQASAAALAAEQAQQAELAQAAERSLALATAKAEERRAQELLAEQAETQRRIAERNRLSNERARAAEFARSQAAARAAEQAQEQLLIVPKPNTISDSDFDYVTEQFHGLKTAIEQRDIAAVIGLTDRSGKRIHQMLQLFENNAGIKARVVNTSSRVADGVVVGTLKIEKLTKSSGAVVNAPSNLSSISISSKRGPAGWSAIKW